VESWLKNGRGSKAIATLLNFGLPENCQNMFVRKLWFKNAKFGAKTNFVES